MSTINPATGYVAGSMADKAALRGDINKKPVANTSPTTSQPKTGVQTNIGTTAVTQAGADRVNARSQNKTPTSFTPTPGVDPTTGKASATVTGGVPIFTGSTNYTSPTTGFQPVDLSKSKDIIAKEAYANLKKQFPDASNEWLSLQAQTIADRSSGELNPKYEERLNQATEEARMEAERQQREYERQQRNLASATDRAVRSYGEQIDPMFEVQRQQAAKQAEQRTSIQERMLGARGGLTSAYGAQQLEGIQEDLMTVIRGIEAEKQAKMDLFRAQREGADAETLSALMGNVVAAQQNAANLKAQSIQWLMEAEMAAEAAGDANMQAFYEQMAAAIVEESAGVDEERSKQAGYFIDMDGNFMIGTDGEPMQFKPGFEKTGVFQTGNQMAIAIIGPDGVPKVTPLGPAKPSGSRGPIDPNAGKIQIYDSNTKTFKWVAPTDELKVGQIPVSKGNQNTGITKDALSGDPKSVKDELLDG